MENNFQETQRERITLEKKVKYWADRYNKIESPILKQSVNVMVRNLIYEYPTQIPAREYHMERYERLRDGK